MGKFDALNVEIDESEGQAKFCFPIDMLAKKWIDASNENMLSCEKDIFTYNINRPMPQV